MEQIVSFISMMDEIIAAVIFSNIYFNNTGHCGHLAHTHFESNFESCIRF